MIDFFKNESMDFAPGEKFKYNNSGYLILGAIIENITGQTYADFIEEFEAANPGVKVEYTQYTVTTYNEYLKPALSSGQGPDVFAVYPGPDVDEVVNAGHLVNITAEADDEWKRVALSTW